jgi:PHD/YefM family antitoxin component YafN of YafNO toxin-antitoxin module
VPGTDPPARPVEEAGTKAAREQYVDGEGKKMGVILPVSEYEQLLEDLHDLAVVAERHGEKIITLEEMKRRLKTHGLL